MDKVSFGYDQVAPEEKTRRVGGVFFSVALIAFAGAAILYDTSNVIHHFPEDRYVAASLELFASVALMFWYVLRLFIASRD